MKKYFEINSQEKKFIFTEKNFKELFDENSEAHKAFKAAMALGCYEGFVPVMKETTRKKKKASSEPRNINVVAFNELGVVSWIKENNPDWEKKWTAAGKVVQADNRHFSFMVKKNYFLFENAAAREYCGMKANPQYILTPNAKILKKAVETYLAHTEKEV